MDKTMWQDAQMLFKPTAVATDSVNGESLQGAIHVSQDVWLYPVTDTDLELSATVRGIRFL